MFHKQIAEIETDLRDCKVSVLSLAVAIRLEFANNWLSVGNFAAGNGIPVPMAERLLEVCKEIHESALKEESGIATPFHVLGDGNTVLQECETESDARRWIAGYTKGGDWGGYEFITLESYGPEVNDVIETFDNPAFD